MANIFANSICLKFHLTSLFVHLITQVWIHLVLVIAHKIVRLLIIIFNLRWCPNFFVSHHRAFSTFIVATILWPNLWSKNVKIWSRECEWAWHLLSMWLLQKMVSIIIALVYPYLVKLYWSHTENNNYLSLNYFPRIFM